MRLIPALLAHFQGSLQEREAGRSPPSGRYSTHPIAGFDLPQPHTRRTALQQASLAQEIALQPT